MNKPKISIIIPTFNEATYIDRLLMALDRQNYKDFEVIVSDAQSKDGIKEVIEKFKRSINLKFIEAPPKGPGFGRNQGAKIASGEWLLFLDADVDIADPDFLHVLLSQTQNRGWTTASAKMTIDNRFRFDLGVWFFYHYQKFLAHTKHPVAQGYCILTKRAVFEANHGFNEKILLGEDNDYVSRVRNFGFIDKTYYFIDKRRNKNEGLKFIFKATANEIYRHTHGYNLEANRYAYEFGKHPKRKNK